VSVTVMNIWIDHRSARGPAARRAQWWRITIRPRIVAAAMSKGADLCQSFTSFGMFKCALLTIR
jgi:hypothetical protein